MQYNNANVDREKNNYRKKSYCDRSLFFPPASVLFYPVLSFFYDSVGDCKHLCFHDLDAQVLVAQKNVEKDPKRRKPVCNIYQKYLFGPRNASFMHSGSAASRSNWTTVRYWKFVVLCKAKKTKVIEWHGIRMSHCS